MKVGELRKQLDYFSDDDEICFIDENEYVIAFEGHISWSKGNVYENKNNIMVYSEVDSESKGKHKGIFYPFYLDGFYSDFWDKDQTEKQHESSTEIPES